MSNDQSSENLAPGGLEDLISSIDGELRQLGAPTTRMQAAARTSAPSNLVRYVVFTLVEVRYAIPLANVLEIQRPPVMMPLPNVPHWILGVTNLRGEIVSGIDLRGFFGLESLAYDQYTRVMVVQALEDGLTTAMAVDRVQGIQNLNPERIDGSAAPQVVAESVAPFVVGLYEVDESVLVVLDIERLLTSGDMRQFEPA